MADEKPEADEKGDNGKFHKATIAATPDDDPRDDGDSDE